MCTLHGSLSDLALNVSDTLCCVHSYPCRVPVISTLKPVATEPTGWFGWLVGTSQPTNMTEPVAAVLPTGSDDELPLQSAAAPHHQPQPQSGAPALGFEVPSDMQGEHESLPDAPTPADGYSKEDGFIEDDGEGTDALEDYVAAANALVAEHAMAVRVVAMMTSMAHENEEYEISTSTTTTTTVEYFEPVVMALPHDADVAPQLEADAEMAAEDVGELARLLAILPTFACKHLAVDACGVLTPALILPDDPLPASPVVVGAADATAKEAHIRAADVLVATRAVAARVRTPSVSPTSGGACAGSTKLDEFQHLEGTLGSHTCPPKSPTKLEVPMKIGQDLLGDATPTQGKHDAETCTTTEDPTVCKDEDNESEDDTVFPVDTGAEAASGSQEVANDNSAATGILLTEKDGYEVELTKMIAFWKDAGSAADTDDTQDDSTATASADTITATQTVHSSTGDRNETYTEGRVRDSIVIATKAINAGIAEFITSANATMRNISVTFPRLAAATESAHAALAASKAGSATLWTAKPRTIESRIAATAAETATRQEPVLSMGGPPSECIHDNHPSLCKYGDCPATHAALVRARDYSKAVATASSPCMHNNHPATCKYGDCPALLAAGKPHKSGVSRASSSPGKEEGKAAFTVGSWLELERSLNEISAPASPNRPPRASRATPEAIDLHQDLCDRYPGGYFDPNQLGNPLHVAVTPPRSGTSQLLGNPLHVAVTPPRAGKEPTTADYDFSRECLCVRVCACKNELNDSDASLASPTGNQLCHDHAPHSPFRIRVRTPDFGSPSSTRGEADSPPRSPFAVAMAATTSVTHVVSQPPNGQFRPTSPRTPTRTGADPFWKPNSPKVQ